MLFVVDKTYFNITELSTRMRFVKIKFACKKHMYFFQNALLHILHSFNYGIQYYEACVRVTVICFDVR